MHCQGITKRGRPCNKHSSQNSNYCFQHHYIEPTNIGYFSRLPQDLLEQEVFSLLSFKDKLALSQTSKDINRLFCSQLREMTSVPSIIWQVFLRDIHLLKSSKPTQVFSYIYLCYSFPWCSICFTYSNLQDKYTFEIDPHASSSQTPVVIQSTTKTIDSNISIFKQALDQAFLDKIDTNINNNNYNKKELLEYSFTNHTKVLCFTNISSIYDTYKNLQYPPLFAKTTKVISHIIFFT